MTVRGKHFYEFGPFRIDIKERLLLRDGHSVALTPKSFDTLLVLVQNGGHILEKGELMKMVWPDTAVEENNLTQNISAIRKALGEGPEGQSYIETVPRRGYRFVARVRDTLEEAAELNVRKRTPPSVGGQEETRREVDIAATSGIAKSAGRRLIEYTFSRFRRRETEPGMRIGRGWVMGASAALLLIIIALATPSIRNPILFRSPETAGKGAGVPSLTQGKYVAVLPFRVQGGPSSLDYIAEGLVAALSARLFGLHGVHVASATAVERATKKGPLEKIAGELGANLLVQGTLQGTADRIRIIVNLEDVADGRRLWSQEFRGAPQDILTLEDQVYSKLAAALELVTNPELGRGAGHSTQNIEAYDLYLRGKDAMRRRQDLKNVAAAIRFHEEALKKDPGFALAYAGVADACLEMYRQRKDTLWAEKALMAAQQALRLNSDLPEVHFTLGSVYEVIGKAEEAIAEENRALELAPNSDEGYRRLGNAYRALGRKEEALQAYQKAIQINPYYWFNFNVLGYTYFQWGDYDKALSAFRRVTELEPDNVYGYENVGGVYLRQGKWNESISFYQKALHLQPHFVAYSNLGTAYFYLKRYHEAARIFEKAAEMNPNDEVVLGNLADAYRWSGQSSRALAAYERAIALAYKELQVNARNASAMQSLALYYAKKGDSMQALDFIRRARSLDRNNVQIIYAEAVVKALAGQSNEALDALREAFRTGYPPEEASTDPELKNLRTRPEFERLIREASRKHS